MIRPELPSTAPKLSPEEESQLLGDAIGATYNVITLSASTCASQTRLGELLFVQLDGSGDFRISLIEP